MDTQGVKPSLLVFDVYKTLLQVGPSLLDKQRYWEALWQECFGHSKPRLGLDEFNAKSKALIEDMHARSKADGVDYPEIVWEDVVEDLLPELDTLTPVKRERFIHQQTRMWHSIRLDDGCVPVLREAKRRGLPLGLASNAQRYTLWELRHALLGGGLDIELFERDLSFWSFERGFAKPSPGVFRFLSDRARERGIEPGRILMIGDRLDNDIEPAKAEGWQTWHFRTESDTGSERGGDWKALQLWLWG